MRALLLALPLLAAQGGCTVMAVSASDDSRPNNRCSNDEDCGDGGACRSGVCQTLNSTLEALLITADPPSNSTLPHLTFVMPLADVPTQGQPKDLELPGPAQVTGSLSLPANLGCYPSFVSSDGKPVVPPLETNTTVPVTVTLALRQRQLGLPQQVYYARSGGVDAGSYTFKAQVPAGEYDIYMAPPKLEDGPCIIPIPPQLYRKYPIGLKDDDGVVVSNPTFQFRLSAISNLNLLLRWPVGGQTLDGWTADIIEPFAGNPISTQVVLADPTADGYLVPLAYSTVLGSDTASLDSSGDLLRLRPPAGSFAPTIFLDRSAIGLLQNNPADQVLLTAFTRFPTPVTLHGQLLRLDQGTSVAGVVTLRSTEIYGVDPGVFASFQQTVEVGPNGQIEVSLPPGKYRVHGEPPLPFDGPPELSAAETVWEVPADVAIQFGKALDLPPILELRGHARVPGAEVHALPTAQMSSPFEDVFGTAQFAQRASSGLVDDGGGFSLQVDSGQFDVSVQSPEALGFGWFVRPGVQVGERNLELGPLTLPKTAVLAGAATVALSSGPMPLASSAIRAYAYLNKDLVYTRDPEQAVSLIQVGATRADENGRFRLLLPATLSGAK